MRFLELPQNRSIIFGESDYDYKRKLYFFIVKEMFIESIQGIWKNLFLQEPRNRGTFFQIFIFCFNYTTVFFESTKCTKELSQEAPCSSQTPDGEISSGGSFHSSPACVGNKAKGRISRRVLQENKAHQIFRKTKISYPLCLSGGKKCSFFENLACFVFLKHPFRDSPFCLITGAFCLPKTKMCSRGRPCQSSWF